MTEKESKDLYDIHSLEIMRTAEDGLDRSAGRVMEIKNFAREAGIRRIGIAHCVAFPKEAEAVKKFFSNDFEVYSVDCKCGQISKKEMLGLESNSIMCNPAGQAQILKEKNTELNISMGLCVGHDMIFNKNSAAPVTVLIVKDRENKYNPMESLRRILKID